jgi:endonuclease/exonuclease/phosphatase (EEP) superfamily protein YafD
MPRILAWNLFHGRAQPSAGRDLFEEFATTIAGWPWQVALLQEVPPWWPRPLAERSRASMRMALTSRNGLLPLRRALALRLPDLVRSEGGGANAILVRGRAIAEHRVCELTRRPERRVMHAVRLDDGTWAGNLHASTQSPRARTEADVRTAVAALDRWADGAPRVLLGGDYNMDHPPVATLRWMGGGGVDYVYARGFTRVSASSPRRGGLSDHRPVLVELAPA